MNKAEKLDAAIGCIDERYLALADITGREITRMKNDTAVFSRRKAVRIALLAVVAAVLLTVGAYAAGSGGAGKWTGYDAKNYGRLPTAAQCVRDAGYIPVLTESFANGYGYSGGSMRVHQAYDAEYTLTEETRGFDFTYEKDGDKVFFGQYVSFSDGVVMNGSIAATVSDLDIYYHSAVYKTVPESYVFTAQDIADRDSGRVVFSYDSDKGADMSETVVNTAQWRKGDRFFLLQQLDGALTKDELVGMACEAARLLAERAA